MANPTRKDGAHQSLIRPLLYAGGVREEHIYLEIGIFGACLAFMDLSLQTVGVGFVIVLLLHPALVYTCRVDPVLLILLGDSFTLQDYYPAQAEAEAKPPRSVPVSVPD